MKKNKFWIVIIVLFVVIGGLYIALVSSEREKLSREEESKKRNIKDLEGIRERAKSGHLANDATRATIDKGVKHIGQRINDIESYLRELQRDFLYIKGEKDWKPTSQTIIEYKEWYKNKRNDLFNSLQQSGFVFEKESSTVGELTPADYDNFKEKIGFRTWGSDQPTDKDVLIAHQQLALMAVVIESMLPIFRDKKNVHPVFQKVSFDVWMAQDNQNNNLLNSKVIFKIDCPYAYINLVINELEKSKLHLNVDDMEVIKKQNAKDDYAEFPNVTVVLNLSFQTIKDKKVNQ